MPPRSIPRTVQGMVFYLFSRHALAPNAGSRGNFGFIIDRYKRFASGEFQLEQFDLPLRQWINSTAVCCFCGKRTKGKMTLIAPSDGGPPCPFNQVPACRECRAGRGAERLTDWWYETLKRNSTTLPELAIACWVRMAYARHQKESSLATEADGFRDLWRWSDDGGPWWVNHPILHAAEVPVSGNLRERQTAWTLHSPWQGQPLVGELVAWSYACFATVCYIARCGRSQYQSDDFRFRSSFYYRMRQQTIQPRSLSKDEVEKLHAQPVCAYCGSKEKLSADHLLPTARGGPDEGFNLVLACKSCNSSKGCKDLLQWYEDRQATPPLPLIRRYLKLVVRYCKQHGLWDTPVDRIDDQTLPFRLSSVTPSFLILESQPARPARSDQDRGHVDDQLSLWPADG